MGELSFALQAHSLPHLAGLSCIMTDGASTSSAHLPPTTNYPELTTPYSAVSSFNYPTHADASLLTPVSAAGSPPLHQGHKFPGRYVHSGAPHHPQDPTSPATSRMYPWPPIDMTGQQPRQSHVPQEFLASPYLQSERRMTPGPPEHSYTGSYGVSEGSEHSHGLSDAQGTYYMQISEVDQPHSGMMTRDDSSMVIEPDPDPMRPQMPVTPLMTQAKTPNPRSSRGSSGKSTSAKGASGSGSLSDVPEVPRSSGSTGNTTSRRRPSAPRIRKHKSSRKGSHGQSPSEKPGPAGEHRNCLGQEVAPQLKSSCPPEERCIFEARWENRGKKGQDMWDSIQAIFEERFNQRYNKEMLQMRYKRARSKFYEWLPQDLDILTEAFYETEKERYQTILDKFIEKGGSRNMQLNAGDIEVKLATELKLEEGFYIDSLLPDMAVRRRNRKVATRRRNAGGSGAGTGEDSDLVGHDDIASVDSHNTANEDEVIHQVHAHRNLSWDDGSSHTSPGMMDVSMHMKM